MIKETLKCDKKINTGETLITGELLKTEEGSPSEMVRHQAKVDFINDQIIESKGIWYLRLHITLQNM